MSAPGQLAINEKLDELLAQQEMILGTLTKVLVMLAQLTNPRPAV